MRRSVPCKYKFKSDSLSEDNYRVDLECGGTDQQEDAEFLAEAKAKALCKSKLSKPKQIIVQCIRHIKFLCPLPRK